MMTTSSAVRPHRSTLGKALGRLRPQGLFAKYALTIVCLVVLVLALTGAMETWIIYRETTTAVAHEQKDTGKAIAGRIDTFFVDLERQISFVTRASAITAEDHRADYSLLLEQVPAVAELDYIGGDSHERIRVTRAQSEVDLDLDLSQNPVIRSAAGRSLMVGPVYLVGPDPFLTIAMAHTGLNAGTTVVHVDLHALAALVEATPQSGANYAYVLTASDRVVAASRASPVEVGADLTAVHLGKVLADDTDHDSAGKDAEGHLVIRTAVRLRATDWFVVAEITSREALRPIFDFLVRLAGLLILGLALAIFAGLILARRMTGPIQALNQGAAEFAANRFDYRITIRTGDELEQLANQFNRMADELAGSYARLELKVEARTRDLAQSVRELKALEEIGRTLSSSLDVAAVFSTIVSRAIDLTEADAGAIYSQEEDSPAFRLEEEQGLPLAMRTAASSLLLGDGGAVAAVLLDRGPLSVPDLAREPSFPLRAATLEAGFRSALVVALSDAGGTRGALVVFRKTPGDFLPSTLGVMQTFAHQAVLALHNARLFQELKNKSQQLEIANAHRTQFFANMSHELRTPLNAVLGYSELLFDGLYGAMPERALGVLDRIQINGKHLLGLINDVLDLTKMEAGALTLSLNDYSMKGLIDGVIASTESLAKTKNLAFEAAVTDDLPIGHGDDRRLTQVVLNLVGNALKFTDEGGVYVTASARDGRFHVAVRDTGPGISPEAQDTIFEEFRQVEDAETQKKGGSGLGLSISRRLVAMHCGHIEILSSPGSGATFTMVVPIRVEEQSLVP